MTLDLHAFQAQLRDFRTELERHPTAAWRAWERPWLQPPDEEPDPERFTQAESVRALQHSRTVVVWGGSRSGKTAAQLAAGVALLVGSDHPDARAFWLLNGCDPDLFPTGPAQGWVVALTSNASLQYHRRQVLALLPRTGPEHPLSEVRGQPWHAWNIDGKGEARVDIMVPGYADAARIVFKSEDPGEDAAKGDKCRWILHDEEGSTPEFFDEAEKRLWDLDGWQILCNTPTRGKRWAYYRFVPKVPPRTWVGWLWAMDNPHISKARVEAQGDRPDVLARTKGKFTDSESTVFQAWSPSRHVVHGLAELIPAEWPRWRAIDFGYRDPFCCLWLTYSRAVITLPDGRVIADGSVLFYREWYQAEMTLPLHAEAMKRAEGWLPGANGTWARGPKTEKVVGGWADTKSPGLIASLTEDFGLTVVAADKRREAGVELIQRLLYGDAAGPRLFVDASCVHLIEQIPDAQYTDSTKETIRETEDHSLDPCRYGCMGIMEEHSKRRGSAGMNRAMGGLLKRFGG